MLGQSLLHSAKASHQSINSAEVSIGGWAVSFLLIERGGSADVGYVSCVILLMPGDPLTLLLRTGFWTGITLGRLTLPHLQARVGDTVCLYIYIGLALLLEFSVWFWKSLIGNGLLSSPAQEYG